MQAAIYSSSPDKIDACEISNYHADISHANFQRYSILITTGQISPTVQLNSTFGVRLKPLPHCSLTNRHIAMRFQ